MKMKNMIWIHTRSLYVMYIYRQGKFAGEVLYVYPTGRSVAHIMHKILVLHTSTSFSINNPSKNEKEIAESNS